MDTVIDPLGPKQRAWVNALKSGDWKQDRGYLETRYGFCCLGVAKKLLCLDELGNLNLRMSYKSLGLRSQGGCFDPPVKCYGETLAELTAINDSGNYSFYDIGVLIETYWANLFTERV